MSRSSNTSSAFVAASSARGGLSGLVGGDVLGVLHRLGSCRRRARFVGQVIGVVGGVGAGCLALMVFDALWPVPVWVRGGAWGLGAAVIVGGLWAGRRGLGGVPAELWRDARGLEIDRGLRDNRLINAAQLVGAGRLRGETGLTAALGDRVEARACAALAGVEDGARVDRRGLRWRVGALAVLLVVAVGLGLLWPDRAGHQVRRCLWPWSWVPVGTPGGETGGGSGTGAGGRLAGSEGLRPSASGAGFLGDGSSGAELPGSELPGAGLDRLQVALDRLRRAVDRLLAATVFEPDGSPGSESVWARSLGEVVAALDEVRQGQNVLEAGMNTSAGGDASGGLPALASLQVGPVPSGAGLSPGAWHQAVRRWARRLGDASARDRQRLDPRLAAGPGRGVGGAAEGLRGEGGRGGGGRAGETSGGSAGKTSGATSGATSGGAATGVLVETQTRSGGGPLPAARLDWAPAAYRELTARYFDRLGTDWGLVEDSP